MRGRELSPLVAGLVALVVVVLASSVAFTGSLPLLGGGGYRLQAVFSTAANQLQPRAPVRVAGVEVGKVTKIEHGPHGTALVTMHIDDRGLPLHRDTAAQLKPRLFLEGNYYVSLSPGSPSAPELASGATVPLTRTSVSVTLGEVLGALDRPTRDSLQRFLHETSGALDGGGARSLNRAFEPAPGALRGLSTTMEDLRGLDDHDLRSFIADQAKVSGALADRRGQLADLVTSFDTTVSALARRPGATAATVSAAARTLSTARPALGDVNAALPPLRRFAVDARPALDEAPATLNAALPFLDQADRLVAPSVLPALTRDLRPTVRTVTALQPRLGRLGQQLDPVARCLRDVVVPTLVKRVPDGALTVNQPVWQELRGFAGALSASQNFDANGPDLRLHLGTGDTALSPLVQSLGHGIALSDQPLAGSSPRFTQGRVPPFRPDVACTSQQPADLDGGSRTAPAPLARGRALDVKAANRVYDALRRGGSDRDGALRALRTYLPAPREEQP